MKKFFNFLMLVIFCFIALINFNFAYFRYFESGQNFLLKRAINFINKRINGTMHVDGLKGNLFGSFSISNIVLYGESSGELSKIASVENVFIHWNYKDLFARKLTVHKVEINDIIVDIEKTADDLLNIVKIFNKKEDKNTLSDDRDNISEERIKDGINSKFDISVDHFTISNVTAGFLLIDGSYVIPEKISIDVVEASLELTNNLLYTNVVLEKLYAISPIYSLSNLPASINMPQQQHFDIDYLKFDFSIEKNHAYVNNLNIHANNSILAGNGEFNYTNFESMEVALKFNPLQIDDFRYFLPDTFVLNYLNDVNLNLELNIDKNDASIDLNLLDGEMNFISAVYIENYLDIFYGRFFDFNNPFTINAEFLNANALKYTDLLNINMSHFDSLAFNANISISADSFDISEAKGSVKIGLFDTTYNDFFVNYLDFYADYDKKDISASLYIESNDNKISAEISLNDFLDVPEYSIFMNVHSLDLDNIVDGFYTDLTGNIEASGKYFHIEDMMANIKIDIIDSFVTTEVIDSLSLTVDIDKGIFSLREFVFFNEILEINAKGQASVTELFGSEVMLLVKYPRDLILSYTGFEIDFNAFAHIEASGTWQSLNPNLQININDVRLKEHYIESIQTYHNISNIVDLESKNRIFAKNIQLNLGNKETPLVIDNLSIEAESSVHDVLVELFVNSEELLDISLKTMLNWEDDMDFTITDFSFFNEFFDWSNQEYFYISIASPRNENRKEDFISPSIIFDNFNIHSEDEHILVNKAEIIGEDIFLNIDLSNINIKRILNMITDDVDIAGNLSLNVVADLKDNVLDLYTDIQVNDLSYYLHEHNHFVNLEEIDIVVHYNHQTLNLTNNMIVQGNEIGLNMSLPIDIDIKNYEITFRNHDYFYSHLSIIDQNLDILNLFLSPETNIGAVVNIDLETKGTLSDPVLNSEINLRSGSLRNTEWGIDFSNAVSNIYIKPDGDKHIINFENMSFNRDRGSFHLNGLSEIDIDFSDIADNGFLKVGKTNLDVQINNLLLMDNLLAKTIISGNLVLSNYSDIVWDPEFTEDENGLSNRKLISLPDFTLTGRIETNELRVSIDEVLRFDTAEMAPEPILVVAQRQNAGITQAVPQKEIFFQMPNFDVNVNIDFAQNFLVHGKGISVELGGRVNFLINNNQPFIDGVLEVGRGYYQYLGKRFNFEEGTIALLGHDLDNPILHIRAYYLFRNPQGQRQRITLYIDGHLQDPEISFYLDGVAIEEGEAISYIVFGREHSFLSQNEVEAVSEIQMVADIGIGLLSSQLTQALQRQFNIDLLEIRGDNQLTQASLTVGRYIGNNLFVSFEKNFDSADMRDFKSDIFSAEYRINRHFYLTTTQSTSYETGIDLIFRWQR